MRKKSIPMRLLQLVKPMSGYMVLAVLLGIVGYLCAIFITICGGYAMLHVLGQEGTIALAALLALIVVLAVLRAGLRYGEQLMNHYIAFKLLAEIRNKVFLALRRLCPAKLEGKKKGNLISMITADIELLEVFYAHTVSPIAIALVVSAVMIVFIGRLHPLLGLVAAGGYLVVGVVLPRITSLEGRKFGQEFREGFGELNGYFLDSIRGIGQTVQYGNQQEREECVKRKTAQLLQKQKQLKATEAKSGARTSAVIVAFAGLMLVLGVLLWQRGQVDFSRVLIASIAMISSFGPVVALSSLSNNLLHTFAAGQRVFSLLDEQPVVEEVEDGMDVAFCEAALEDVSFSYDKEQILRSFHLKINKGDILGVSGKSGSGKSTMLKLLMRFWDVDSGTVSISQEDIRKINTRALRAMQSYMTQDTVLFHESLLENIRIAKPEASQQEVEEACKKASIHEFIEGLPSGYQTNAGELGSHLSGGERQRIGLARAFLHDAPLVLLDEPTSNLDSLNEAVILRSICEEKQGRTFVLVSHRPSTMRIANRVVTVESGRES